MRKPSVAGSFYKADASKLKKQVQHYLSLVHPFDLNGEVQALIVPHAGYIYSGEVAASAYQQLNGNSFKNVFLIGTSHKKQFPGAAIYNGEAFEMPMGKVSVNVEITDKLINASSLFQDDELMHTDEHSLEVQLPFLQSVLGESFSIVPILLGTNNPDDCKLIASHLKPYFNSDNLFVISTDFSHYPNAVDAFREDENTADAIISNDPQVLLEVLSKHKTNNVQGFLTGLCGWSAVLILMYLSADCPDSNYHHILYQNSGDKGQKDTSRVVGYHAIALTQQKKVFTLDKVEKETLLRLCHHALYKHWGIEDDYTLNDYTRVLDAQVGAFVSVYVQNELRGCIGHMISQKPLYEMVQILAVDAAFYDSRFPKIKQEERDDVQFEISVLTPMQRVMGSDEVELGKHGIFIKKDLQSGTFLPQVGARNNWTVEEFLGYCSRDKAKIGWEGWREAELYTYEAIIFSDK